MHRRSDVWKLAPNLVQSCEFVGNVVYRRELPRLFKGPLFMRDDFVRGVPPKIWKRRRERFEVAAGARCLQRATESASEDKVARTISRAWPGFCDTNARRTSTIGPRLRRVVGWCIPGLPRHEEWRVAAEALDFQKRSRKSEGKWTPVPARPSACRAPCPHLPAFRPTAPAPTLCTTPRGSHMHISSSLAVLLLLAMTLPPWAAQAANVTLNDLNVGLASVKIPMAGGFGAGAPYYFYYKTVRLGPDSIVHMKADFASGGVLGNGWVGFGLAGPNSQMAGGVAVIGCQDSSYPAVGLYALSGTSLSNVQLVPGTLAQLGFFNASFTAGAANSTLEVYFNQTAGAAHLVLVPGWAAPAGGNGSAAAASEGVTMIFADGNSLSFSEHAHRTAFALDLVNAGALSQTRELDKALAGHIVFALAAFAFLFPAGASFALCHTRGGPSGAWFKWHRGIQVLGGVCALLCLALGLYHVTALGGTHLSRCARGFPPWTDSRVALARTEPSSDRTMWWEWRRARAWGCSWPTGFCARTCLPRGKSLLRGACSGISCTASRPGACSCWASSICALRGVGRSARRGRANLGGRHRYLGPDVGLAMAGAALTDPRRSSSRCSWGTSPAAGCTAVRCRLTIPSVHSPATTYSIAGMAFAALNLEYFVSVLAMAGDQRAARDRPMPWLLLPWRSWPRRRHMATSFANPLRRWPPVGSRAQAKRKGANGLMRARRKNTAADFVTGTSGVSAPMPGDTPNPKYALAHMKI
jgi:hypothetical protein